MFRSLAALVLLLMVSMYPVMRNLGISQALVCGVIATCQVCEIGPAQSNASFSVG